MSIIIWLVKLCVALAALALVIGLMVAAAAIALPLVLGFFALFLVGAALYNIFGRANDD